MKNIINLFEDAIENWRQNKGIGTALIPKQLDDKVMILGILQNLYNKSPTCSTLIVTNNFRQRAEIIEFLTNQNSENDDEFEELIENHRIRILTEQYVASSGTYSVPFVTIWYHPETVLNNSVYSYILKSKFRLVIINKRLKQNSDIDELYKTCPLLNNFKQIDIDEIRSNSPVEETLIGINIPADSEQGKLLAYYNKYIETSINIFGSFENIEQARIGNNQLNISATNICYDIASKNGWNENLDMSIEYNRQLDELYNPNHLQDRAKEVYEVIRNRSVLLSDYDSKLEEIFKIVSKHKHDKILIINKRGDFASKVTEFINNNSEKTICGNYHDKVEKIPAIDINGKPIYIKSGKNKGQRCQLGAQAQKSLNEKLFNLDKLRVLSTSNSPDKNLSIDVDVIIITSPLCENIKNYFYRLSKINVSSPLKLYTICIKNSLEEKQLENRPLSNNHIIVKKYENEVKCENNSDFIIVD